MPHSRTDTGQDDLCLRYLPGCEYKTYRYLVNRADPIGVCYPKQATIAAAINVTEREVQRALEMLHDNAVFRYRRRNAVDPDTRRRLFNVYQVNPLLLVIPPELEAEAWTEWEALINQCGNISIRLLSRINQHQEPIPRTNSMEPVSGTSTNQSAKADGPADDDANQREGTDSTTTRKARGKKQNSAGETGQRAARTNQRPQAAEQTGSGGAGRYVNPDSINTNLPDPAHEKLANDLRKFGIGTPLGRGFVAVYGYNRTKLAYDQVVKMGDKAREPAAVFRSILQIRLTEDFATEHQKIFNQRRG